MLDDTKSMLFIAGEGSLDVYRLRQALTEHDYVVAVVPQAGSPRGSFERLRAEERKHTRLEVLWPEDKGRVKKILDLRR